jgi:hypothetical protein
MVQVVSNLGIYDGEASALRQSNWKDSKVLAAGVATTFQAPTLAKYVLFSANGDFYCQINETSVAATVPVASTTDGTASELNPAMRQLPINQAYISLIAAVDTIVTAMFYRQ